VIVKLARDGVTTCPSLYTETLTRRWYSGAGATPPQGWLWRYTNLANSFTKALVEGQLRVHVFVNSPPPIGDSEECREAVAPLELVAGKGYGELPNGPNAKTSTLAVYFTPRG
jgi:hypothetical protein